MAVVKTPPKLLKRNAVAGLFLAAMTTLPVSALAQVSSHKADFLNGFKSGANEMVLDLRRVLSRGPATADLGAGIQAMLRDQEARLKAGQNVPRTQSEYMGRLTGHNCILEGFVKSLQGITRKNVDVSPLLTVTIQSCQRYYDAVQSGAWPTPQLPPAAAPRTAPKKAPEIQKRAPIQVTPPEAPKKKIIIPKGRILEA